MTWVKRLKNFKHRNNCSDLTEDRSGLSNRQRSFQNSGFKEVAIKQKSPMSTVRIIQVAKILTKIPYKWQVLYLI
jgi:hypothetical protein